jgi:ABC-type bacteriocin/lantibiotic exporter with double-glycine peptidase domain
VIEACTGRGLAAGIEFDAVGFRYADGEPAVLGGVSLSIAPGESVALVGPPGCGKTTLVGDIGDAADAGTRWSTNCGAS